MAMSRKVIEITPSFHSLVAVMYPYSSLRVTALGLMMLNVDFSWYMFCAFCSVFRSSVLPEPAGPSMNTDQRTTSSSRS